MSPRKTSIVLLTLILATILLLLFGCSDQTPEIKGCVTRTDSTGIHGVSKRDGDICFSRKEFESMIGPGLKWERCLVCQ